MEGEKLSSSQVKERIRRQTVLRRILIAVLTVLAILSGTPLARSLWQSLYAASGFSPDLSPPLTIHVIDVGKADAIFIQCEGHTALLDAGTYLSGDTVVDYLARCGVESLDYVIASHPDADHIGGMPQVLREVKTGAFLRSKYDRVQYEGVREVLGKRSIPEWVLSPGDTVNLGGAVFTVLGPLREYGETNNDSLVLRLDYEGFSALFCGDMESAAELDLLKANADLQVNLLKVAHHGSKTSSTDRFLKKVSPDYAVISVGNDGSDLPDEETLIRLEAAGAEIYRTDLDNTVVFSYDGTKISVATEHEKG